MFNDNNTYTSGLSRSKDTYTDKDVSVSHIAVELENNPRIWDEREVITDALIKGLETANEELDVAADTEGCIETIDDTIRVFELLNSIGEEFPLEASGDDSFGLSNESTFDKMLYVAEKFIDSDSSEILLRHTQRMIEYRDCFSLKELAEDEVYGTFLEIQEIYSRYAY